MKSFQKILFYLSHPAHYHFFSQVIRQWPQQERLVAIKTKDVLEELLLENQIPCINIDRTARSHQRSFFRLAIDLFNRSRKIASLVRQHRIRLIAGSAAEVAIVGRLAGIPSYVFFEDDFEKIKPFAWIAGPLADYLVCPDCCSAWKWNHKKIGYAGYHELAYLHPDHFKADENIAYSILERGRKNFLLRFSRLGAYHDKGITGFTDEKAIQLVNLLLPHGRVFITSERKLPAELEAYRIPIRAMDMHHVLAFVDLYIGDSQTMTAEAAILGTPALRYNDFVRQLSYLEELEYRYDLTYGFPTSNFEELLSKTKELLHRQNLKKEWQEKRNRMLKEKINTAHFFCRLLTGEKDLAAA
jgi:predicted glycosyltransferase